MCGSLCFSALSEIRKLAFFTGAPWPMTCALFRFRLRDIRAAVSAHLFAFGTTVIVWIRCDRFVLFVVVCAILKSNRGMWPF